MKFQGLPRDIMELAFESVDMASCLGLWDHVKLNMREHVYAFMCAYGVIYTLATTDITSSRRAGVAHG